MPEFPAPPPRRMPMPPPPRVESESKRPLIGVVAAAVAILFVIGLATQGNEQPSGGTDIGSDIGGGASSWHSVTYRVSGDSRQADVTYQNENADTSQQSGVPVPWSYSFHASGSEFVYISAQRGGTDGDITCSIEVDGTTVETNTSSGPYTICTASGSL